MSELVVRDVPPREWHDAAEQAREQGFDFFDWLTAVDQSDAETDPGLDVLCHLLATPGSAPARGAGTGGGLVEHTIRTRVGVNQELTSLTDLWAGAAWHERETHEMFGQGFVGFQDDSGLGLRPLLLPDGFDGTPLRKSFVLAARVSKPWPGAKEPGEGGHGPAHSPQVPARRPRRRMQPPGLPDPSWGPR